MKKLFAFALCLTALLILCTITASAVVNKDGHYTEEAKKIDEIMAGQAGEGEISVLYQGNMDGTTIAEFSTLYSMLMSDDAEYLSDDFIAELQPIWDDNTWNNVE